MKTSLFLLSLLFCGSLLAAPTSVLFRTQFAPDGSISDVDITLTGKDADGFSTSRVLKSSTLPAAQQTQFAAIQSALAATASAGGWHLVSGELAQTGSTSDFTTQANPRAGEPMQPATIQVPTPGTERPILTLWQTQQRNGSTRYQTMTSEQFPPQLRDTLLALWVWLQTQP